MIAQCLAAGASPAHDRARYLAPTTPSTRPPSTSTPPAIGFFGAIRAIRAAARLTSTERLVLLVIASHADNRTGEAWPSIPTLAAECGFTTRTIERTIAALAAAGWLARDSAAGPWGTNRYRVTPRPDDVRPPSPRRYGRPFDRATPDRASGDPPSPVRVTPDTRSADLLLWDLHEGSAVNAAPPPRGPHTQPDFEVDQEHETHEAPAAAAELVDVEPVVPEGPVEPVDVEPVVPPAGVHETAVELVDVEPVVPEAAAWRPGPLPLAAVAMSSAHQLRESDSLGAVAKRSAKRDASTVVPEGPVEPVVPAVQEPVHEAAVELVDVEPAGPPAGVPEARGACRGRAGGRRAGGARGARRAGGACRPGARRGKDPRRCAPFSPLVKIALDLASARAHTHFSR